MDRLSRLLLLALSRGDLVAAHCVAARIRGAAAMTGHLNAEARRGAAVIRRRAFDRRFRPFTHKQFLSSTAIQRFAPGPTWSYVPLRDRPLRP